MTKQYVDYPTEIYFLRDSRKIVGHKLIPHLQVVVSFAGKAISKDY